MQRKKTRREKKAMIIKKQITKYKKKTKAQNYLKKRET